MSDPTPQPIPGQLDLVPADLDQQEAAARAELDRLDALRADRRRLARHRLEKVTADLKAGDAELTSAVQAARLTGLTWQEIADVLDVKRQSAWERWHA